MLMCFLFISYDLYDFTYVITVLVSWYFYYTKCVVICQSYSEEIHVLPFKCSCNYYCTYIIIPSQITLTWGYSLYGLAELIVDRNDLGRRQRNVYLFWKNKNLKINFLHIKDIFIVVWIYFFVWIKDWIRPFISVSLPPQKQPKLILSSKKNLFFDKLYLSSFRTIRLVHF